MNFVGSLLGISRNEADTEPRNHKNKSALRICQVLTNFYCLDLTNIVMEDEMWVIASLLR